MLEKWRNENPGKVCWVHCASLGEFEQGRPVMEAAKEKHPDIRIVLTFFSPSGYEVRKNYAIADLVLYLPSDTPSHARKWLDILRPDVTIFVKYEYWANYFLEMKRRNIALYVVSAIFRRNQRFFGAQRSFWREVLSAVRIFFVQNAESAQLISLLDVSEIVVAGDTRYDRVKTIADRTPAIAVAEDFRNHRTCIVSGSSYAAEDEALKTVLEKNTGCCAIVAPHYIHEERLQQIERTFGSDGIRFSRWNGDKNARVLIIDNIGMLSALYRSADIAVVGGGFGKGIHNTLEPAVYGVPVLFGPRYEKFEEAVLMVENGGAIANADPLDLERELNRLLHHPEEVRERGKLAGNQVLNGTGAVDIVLERIDFHG